MDEMKEIGARMKLLRDMNGISMEEMASDLKVSVETYSAWEATGEDVPVSALYHVARKCDVEFTEILTGESESLRTYQVVRSGEGKEVDRYAGYHYEDLAWRFADKTIAPFLITIDPVEEPAKLVSHTGQEFNYVIEGTVIVNWGDKEFTLNAGDSIYFNPSMPHGQRNGGDTVARFVSFIVE